MIVVLIDDHPLLTQGLALGLRSRGVCAYPVQPAPEEELLSNIQTISPVPGLAVLDYAMPEISAPASLVQSLATLGWRVVMLSGSDERMALAECLQSGAEAVVSKSEPVETILDALAEAASGRAIRGTDRACQLAELQTHLSQQRSRAAVFDSLTRREREVFDLLIEGRSAGDIAAVRFVSVSTVRTQIKAILRKLGVSSQLEAVALAARLEYVPESDERLAG